MVSLNFERVQLLKKYRVNNNVKSIDMAKAIGLSSAYISKFEKGDFKTIEDDVLNKIIKVISINIQEQNEILEKFNNTLIEISLFQQLKEKISQTESYLLDFNKLSKIIEGNVSVDEQTQNLLIQNAKRQINLYKKELHELIDKIENIE